MRSRQNQSKVNDVYILTGDDELKCLIEVYKYSLIIKLYSPNPLILLKCSGGKRQRLIDGQLVNIFETLKMFLDQIS